MKKQCLKIWDEIYNWLLFNLPHRLMWKERSIDSQHTMWFPRWKMSKKSIIKAEKRAKKLSNDIKWE